jgi:hypothetical protein
MGSEPVLDKVILIINILLFIVILIVSIFTPRFNARFPFGVIICFWVCIYVVIIVAFIITGDIPEANKLFTVWSNVMEFFNAVLFTIEFVMLSSVFLCVQFNNAADYDKVDLVEEDEEHVKLHI